jgi:hypothetical protein
VRHMFISFSRKNSLFTSASRSWISCTPWPDWDAGEMLAATTPEQILALHCGISSSRHQPLNPWTATASSSKCTGSSLASAWGLRWWRATAARVDFRSKQRQQKQQWKETWMDLFTRQLSKGMKTLRVSASIYKPTSATTAVERIFSSG